MGRYDEALEILKRAVIRWPNHLPTHQYLAAIYTELGQETEAQAELAEVLRINPKHSLDEMSNYPYKDPAYLVRLRGHMRKAGLK
jgi:tetratricopeptide (TPR) repeat protein